MRQMIYFINSQLNSEDYDDDDDDDDDHDD